MKQKPYLAAAAFLGLLILILDSRTALEGAREGLELCLRTVVPSLFPFFVLSVVLTSSLTEIPLLKPLGQAFGLEEGLEGLLVPAFLGGYPVGAQSVALLYRSGNVEKGTAQRLLAFCSNAGPAFLFGMGSGLFSEGWMPWALWGVHVGSAWMVSRILPAGKNTHSAICRTGNTSPDVLALSLRVMAQVCGWVVLFRVIISFLNRWFLWLLPPEASVLVMGLLELSNGFCALSALPSEALRFLLCGGMLAFGGLCVTMQTMSVTKGLSLKYYLAGKGLQTLLSLLLCFGVLLFSKKL